MCCRPEDSLLEVRVLDLKSKVISLRPDRDEMFIERAALVSSGELL